MSLTSKLLSVLLVLLIATACTQKTAVFTTATTLGVDFDSTTQTGVIGYDRTEGFFGPRTTDGKALPVVASMNSEVQLIGGDGRQLFAIGQAAINVQNNSTQIANATLDGGSPMFVGTNSSYGIRVGLGKTSPVSFNLGYKRQELAVVQPNETTGGQAMPSAVGSLDTTGTAGGSNANLGISQYIATGDAADVLSATPMVQAVFADAKKSALEQYADNVARQNGYSNRTLVCYVRLEESERLDAWQNASALGLSPPNAAASLTNASRRLRDASISFPINFDINRDGTAESGVTREMLLRFGEGLYAASIGGDIGSDADRTKMAELHCASTCNAPCLLTNPT